MGQRTGGDGNIRLKEVVQREGTSLHPSAQTNIDFFPNFVEGQNDGRYRTAHARGEARPAHAPVNIAGVVAAMENLVATVCVAELGCTVICVDSDAAGIEALLNGRVPSHEDRRTSSVPDDRS